MNYFKVEKSLPLYEQIYYSLKKMIMDGVFQPGERIFESKIAREFGISRSPVREAIRSLQNEGLLILDQKSQILVYRPSLHDIKEIYQCRMALESMAASLAASQVNDQEIEELEQVLSLTKKALEENDPNEAINQNAKFHDLIIQFSRNRRLQTQLESLRALTHFYRVHNFQGKSRGRTILSDHHGILTELKNRNPEKASHVMSQHMMRDMNHLLQLFQNNNK
ncbi:GntR family transcriptional regulator [Microaerobacter geothermalis]|uniref:GntR family transcriptional regulator n=1 Tax=Microaerobacter geothermalis TaxID=674972 RepID=UPI001F24B420|nr:GntR family transcriptional regulator [Microaerobacter geothermalis]MCF6094863.1 GntR family transcriptional regulator [Microaerobacter geothermalis]